MSDTLTFTFTEDPALNAAADAVAFPPPSQWAIWRDRIINVLIVTLIIFFFEYIIKSPITLRDAIAAFVGAAIVSFWIVPAVFKGRRKAKVQAEKDGPNVVTLTQEGFQAGSNFGHLFVNWQSMEQIHKLEFGFAVVWDNVVFAIPQSAYPHGLTTDDILAKIATWRDTTS